MRPGGAAVMAVPVDLALDPLVLQTARLTLRPLEPRDAPQILALFADPQVTDYMDIAPMTGLAEAKEVIDWACERRARRAGVRWAIRPAGSGVLVGTCGFNALETGRGRRGEVAYDLAPGLWGRGVMSEALAAVIAFGHDRLGLARLEAFVTAGNMRSCRLLERHGFMQEGLLRSHGYWKDRYWDQLVYGRLGPVD